MSTSAAPLLPLPMFSSAPMEVPSAPKKPTPKQTNPKPIPFQVEEMDSTSEMFMLEQDTPAPYDTDIMNKLERVFFDDRTNMLYKLYIDGTWESLKVY